MNPRTKIKVDRDKLIAAIEAKHKRETAAYEKAMQAWPARVRRYNAELARAVTAEVKLEHEDPIDLYNLRRVIKLENSVPGRPSPPKEVDRLLAQLEMSSEPTLPLSVEDFQRYL